MRSRSEIACLPPVLGTNPYQRLLYHHLEPHGFRVAADARLKVDWLVAARHRVGFVHVHWPQSLYQHDRGPAQLRSVLSWLRIALFASRLVTARALGYRIIWTVHQPYPHDGRVRLLDRTAAKLLALASHTLICHDEASLEKVQRAFGRTARRAAVVPHGSYVGVYPAGRPRRDVRAEIGLPDEAFVFLAFGHIRAYKQLGLLLAGFSRLAAPHARLVVAGPVIDEDAARRVLAAADADARIRFVPGEVPDARVAELFGACDAAVLTRTDGGTSGALVLALSLGLPVVSPRSPAYEQLLGGEQAGWLYEPGDPDALAGALARAAVARDSAAAKGMAALERARKLDWAVIASTTVSLLDPRTDVLLVCSSGGHLLQLLALQPAWSGFSHTWVTDDQADTRSLLRDERVVFAHGPTFRNLSNLVRNALLARRVLRSVRPKVVLTTGAAVAVPFAWIARLRGVPVVYVESITRIHEPSLSCRLVAPAVSRLYVQWPELQRAVPRARYAGAVLASR